jgi:hypothetical protein
MEEAATPRIPYWQVETKFFISISAQNNYQPIISFRYVECLKILKHYDDTATKPNMAGV